MCRHTISPIWCAALLLFACSSDLDSPESAPHLEQSQASVLPETAVFAASKRPAEVKRGEIASPKAKIERPAVSAMAPEPPQLESEDRGELRVVTGFERPSAVLYDAHADCYLVANLGLDSDGVAQGYISRVNPEGEVEAERWIDGANESTPLRSPRAMAIIKSRLYVADGGVVRVYDRKSALRRGVINVPGATQISGLTLGKGGALIASDAGYHPNGRPSRSDAVFRINRAGRVSPLFRSSVLGHPAAVQRVGAMVWIATAGSGKVYGLAPDGGLKQGPDIDEGRLSGIVEIDPGELVVTSRVAQGVYRGFPATGFSYVGGGIAEPGHPAWDPSRRRLLVPSEESGELRVLYLDKAKGN